MRRIKLVVSYDGTAYCGWQLQPNGVTIEEVLNKALSSLLKEDIQVIGASRTDSGVHAMGNVAVFAAQGKTQSAQERVKGFLFSIPRAGFRVIRSALRSTSACRTMCGSRRRRRCRLPFIHAR